MPRRTFAACRLPFWDPCFGCRMLVVKRTRLWLCRGTRESERNYTFLKNDRFFCEPSRLYIPTPNPAARDVSSVRKKVTKTRRRLSSRQRRQREVFRRPDLRSHSEERPEPNTNPERGRKVARACVRRVATCGRAGVDRHPERKRTQPCTQPTTQSPRRRPPRTCARDRARGSLTRRRAALVVDHL